MSSCPALLFTQDRIVFLERPVISYRDHFLKYNLYCSLIFFFLLLLRAIDINSRQEKTMLIPKETFFPRGDTKKDVHKQTAHKIHPVRFDFHSLFIAIHIIRPHHRQDLVRRDQGFQFVKKIFIIRIRCDFTHSRYGSQMDMRNPSLLCVSLKMAISIGPK